jgi:cytochrome P450
MAFGWILLQLQMGQAFNENRKVFRKALGPQSVSQYDLLIEQEAESFQKRFSGYSGDPFPVAEASVRVTCYVS